MCLLTSEIDLKKSIEAEVYDEIMKINQSKVSSNCDWLYFLLYKSCSITSYGEHFWTYYLPLLDLFFFLVSIILVSFRTVQFSSHILQKIFYVLHAFTLNNFLLFIFFEPFASWCMIHRFQRKQRKLIFFNDGIARNQGIFFLKMLRWKLS